MSNAKDLIERARMFDERAEVAVDPISRQHYREMAVHYRSLSVEHQEATSQAEQEPAH
jgi:magnesium-transporting ATPase (P-type)